MGFLERNLVIPIIASLAVYTHPVMLSGAPKCLPASQAISFSPLAPTPLLFGFVDETSGFIVIHPDIGYDQARQELRVVFIPALES